MAVVWHDLNRGRRFAWGNEFRIGGGDDGNALKPLGCDPARVRGMSERLIVSHYENNYAGAVKRLNPIGRSICTSTPTTSISVRARGPMSMRSCARSVLKTPESLLKTLQRPAEHRC